MAEKTETIQQKKVGKVKKIWLIPYHGEMYTLREFADLTGTSQERIRGILNRQCKGAKRDWKILTGEQLVVYMKDNEYRSQRMEEAREFAGKPLTQILEDSAREARASIPPVKPPKEMTIRRSTKDGMQVRKLTYVDSFENHYEPGRFIHLYRAKAGWPESFNDAQLREALGKNDKSYASHSRSAEMPAYSYVGNNPSHKSRYMR